MLFWALPAEKLIHAKCFVIWHNYVTLLISWWTLFKMFLDNSKYIRYKNFLLTPPTRVCFKCYVLLRTLFPRTLPKYWIAMKFFSYYVLDDLSIKTAEVASHLHFCAVSTSTLMWAVGTPTLIVQNIFLCFIFVRLHRSGHQQFGAKLLRSLLQPGTIASLLPSLESSARHSILQRIICKPDNNFQKFEGLRVGFFK